MLEDRNAWDGEELVAFFPRVRACGTATGAFQFWMAETARDHLRLGVFFRALAVMLQVPGAAEYDYAEAQDDFEHKLWETDREEMLDVLAECLKQLGRAALFFAHPELRRRGAPRHRMTRAIRCVDPPPPSVHRISGKTCPVRRRVPARSGRRDDAHPPPARLTSPSPPRWPPCAGGECRGSGCRPAASPQTTPERR